MPKATTALSRIDADLDAELIRLASICDRSKSWLANDGLHSHVATEQQFVPAVEQGKQALRDGQTIDHATLVAAFERIVSAAG